MLTMTPASAQFANLRNGHLLGGHRHEQRADRFTSPDEGFDILVFNRAHQLGQMGAFAGRCQMRTFQMKTGDAAVGSNRVLRGLDRRCRRICRIGDQCRQQRRRAVAPVPLGNDIHRSCRRLVVQHAPATAINLRIDETGGKHAAVKQDRFTLGQFAARYDGLHAAIGHDQRFLVVKPLAVKNPCAGENLAGHQMVSVTLSRFAGLSGSKPLRRVTDSIRR